MWAPRPTFRKHWAPSEVHHHAAKHPYFSTPTRTAIRASAAFTAKTPDLKWKLALHWRRWPAFVFHRNVTNGGAFWWVNPLQRFEGKSLTNLISSTGVLVPGSEGEHRRHGHFLRDQFRSETILDSSWRALAHQEGNCSLLFRNVTFKWFPFPGWSIPTQYYFRGRFRWSSLRSFVFGFE